MTGMVTTTTPETNGGKILLPPLETKILVTNPLSSLRRRAAGGKAAQTNLVVRQARIGAKLAPTRMGAVVTRMMEDRMRHPLRTPRNSPHHHHHKVSLRLHHPPVRDLLLRPRPRREGLVRVGTTGTLGVPQQRRMPRGICKEECMIPWLTHPGGKVKLSGMLW